LVEVALERIDGRIAYGEMIQPIPSWEPLEEEAQLLAALGVPASLLPVEVYDNGPRFAYVMVDSEDQVASLEPDIGTLAGLGRFGVSCFAVSGSRVRVRMFGPALGVAEDPATGSAAGPLAVHLARHGRAQFGQRLELTQGVEIGRRSTLYAVADGSADGIERVMVGGSAVIVARGEYALDG
jgi:trans-2,3-dihydro-3-hydroxyanthranilate isomerase